MDETKAATAAFQVVDRDGVRGTLDLTVVPPQGSNSRLVLVRFDDGSQVFADASSFVEREHGIFEFPGSFSELMSANQQSAYGASAFGSSEKVVIPLLEEQIQIARQKILTGGVRVHKTVEERTETVDEPTLREEMEVQRVAVNQFVTGDEPQIRYEDDVMIVPLLEEVLVVEKRLVLREEVRITKRRNTLRNPQQIVLRREQASLEKIQPGADAANIVGQQGENVLPQQQLSQEPPPLLQEQQQQQQSLTQQQLLEEQLRQRQSGEVLPPLVDKDTRGNF